MPLSTSTPPRHRPRRGASCFGLFGAKERPTQAVLVNLDYIAEVKASLAGPGELDLFDATTAQWTSARKASFELILPAGGGQLVRIAQ